jgi:uncharacterized membrane protein YccC
VSSRYVVLDTRKRNGGSCLVSHTPALTWGLEVENTYGGPANERSTCTRSEQCGTPGAPNTGPGVGLVRIEDIAIGCAVSLFVGVLFWPRGANSALGKALAEAFFCGARYLQSAVEFALTRDDGRVRSVSVPNAERRTPNAQRRRAASAASRLDDALRNFLAECGTKHVPLAGVTALTNAVVVLRFTAEAVLRLWQGADRAFRQEQSAASAEVLDASGLVHEWYVGTARA